METVLSALGKLEYAINFYVGRHGLDVAPLETKNLRMEFYAQSKARLAQIKQGLW